MRNTVKYIVDDRGVKTSVIVPYGQWEKIEVFLAIQDGLGELKTAKRHNKKLQTLSEFLNESNG